MGNTQRGVFTVRQVSIQLHNSLCTIYLNKNKTKNFRFNITKEKPEYENKSEQILSRKFFT
jgi:hypothetical protein